MKPSLSERLKIATCQVHTEAERSTFMATLLRGQLGLDSYRDMLVNLHAIYVALEAELERHGANQTIAAVWLAGIARVPALAHDIAAIDSNAALHAPGEDVLLSSTAAYVERLHTIGRDAPELLVAHAYVRYLGDLSGGQILRRIVADGMGAPAAFYQFGSPENAQALRAAFRQGLDRIELDAETSDAVVAEAVTAFERHLKLFDELAANAEVA